jgi:adenosine kinase
MTKTSLICGSIAFDKIMQYHGRFGETLLADQLHRVNVSFLVPTLRTEYGGCAVNIAYNLQMLGGEALIMGTIGQDGGDYLERMEKQGLATHAIRTIGDAYTAQCFVTADLDNNQINAFHPGAMQYSHENNLADFLPLRVAIISPDGRDGMIKHARDCAERGVPFIFDPGQQLPMFNGEELLTFIEQGHLPGLQRLRIRNGDGPHRPRPAGHRGAPGCAGRHARRARLGHLCRRRAPPDPAGHGRSRGRPDRLRRRLPRRPAVRHRQRPGLADHRPPGQPVIGAIKIAHQGGQNHSVHGPGNRRPFEAAFGYRF